MADREIKVKLSVDGKEYETSLGKAAEKTESFGDKIKGLAKTWGAFIGGAAMGAFFKSAVDEASKAEVGMGRLGQAVANAGGDFSKLRPQLEETVASVMRMSSATDDDLREALTRMIAVTGDVQGSQKNLALVTDLAAFKQIDLSQAADVVAKSMNGNTTALNKMGVAGKDANTVIENARNSFGGFAANEANTFSGRLTQVTNQWGEFKESVGNAILANDSVREATADLIVWLAKLAKWVEDNESELSKWASTAVDVARQTAGAFSSLATALGPTLGLLGKAIPYGLQVMSLAFRETAAVVQGFVGDVAYFLGGLVLTGSNLLKVFGINVGQDLGKSLAQWGGEMAMGARKNIEIARETFWIGIGKLEEQGKEANDRQQENTRKNTGIIGGVLRNAQEKEIADLEKANAKKLAADKKLWADTIKGLDQANKSHSAAMKERNTDIEANVTLLNDILVGKLGTGTAQALGITTKAMEDLLAALKGKIPTEDWDRLNLAVQAHKTKLGDLLPPADAFAESVRDAADANKDMEEETKKAKDSLDKAVRSGADLARAFIDAASATGIIDDKMANVLNSAISLASSLPKAFSGDPAAIAQAVTSLANIIVGVGSSETEKRRAAAAAANTSALDRLTREVGNLNLRESGKTFAGVQSAVDASIQARADARASGKGPGAADEAAKAAFIKSLKSQGIGLEEARALFKELFGRDLSMANAGTFFQDIQAFSEGLAATEFGQFGSDFEGQLDAVTKGFDILGTTDDDAKLKEFQQLAGKFSPLLKTALAGDLSTPEGRAQATTNLRELFKKMQSGGLKPEDIGVSGSQFLAMIQTLLPLLAGADGKLGDGSSVAPPPTSAALAGSSTSLGGGVTVGGAVGGPAFSPGLPTPTVPDAFASLGAVAPTNITNNVGDIIFNFPDVTDSQAAADAVAERVASILGATYSRQRTALGLAT